MPRKYKGRNRASDWTPEEDAGFFKKLDLSQNTTLDASETLWDLVSWADDDEGQDYNLLLDAWLAFPGIPDKSELAILKRKIREKFPPEKAEVKQTKKRKRVLMNWTEPAVQEMLVRSEKCGVPPWEILGIQKKAGKFACGN